MKIETSLGVTSRASYCNRTVTLGALGPLVAAREVSPVLVKRHQEDWPAEDARGQDVLCGRVLSDRRQPSCEVGARVLSVLSGPRRTLHE
jgi:hypothetical protein